MSVKVVIFDLYGTLLTVPKMESFSILRNTIPHDVLSRKKWKYLLLQQDYQNLHQLLQVVNQYHKIPDIVKDRFMDILQDELNQIQLFEDTCQVLTKLSKQYQLYLISNLASCFKQPFYDFGLHTFFTHTFFSCEQGLIKPDADFFELVIKKTQVDINSILMVGDNLVSDYHGAQALGIKSLYINRKKQTHPDIQQINTLNQIFNYL